jgi:coproporphyrinogen III oxidase-like Fe-S oxidoreductase
MLYAHVPFCERLCPYCSFNRYPFHDGRARRYFSALRDEMRIIADQGFDFESLYIGGGTPTAQLDELCNTIDLARDLFSIKEVSTETNPNHLTLDYADKLAPRIHRLSIGVQSFDNGLLTQMNRYDKYGSGEWILQRLQEMSGVFDSLNVDLIFNFPSQTEEMLRRDVEKLKECGCNQATLYPLMVPPAVASTLAGTVGEVDYGRERDFFDIVSDGLAGTFEPISAWSFSRIKSGMVDEYIIDYEQYVGAGSGAFSFLQGGLYIETFSLLDYEAAVAEDRTGVTAYRQFPRRDQYRYRFLMELFSLRLDKKRFREDFGVSLERALPLEMTFMRINHAFANDTADEVTLTQKGRYLIVVMMREVFVGINHIRDQMRASLSAEEQSLLFRDETANSSTECSLRNPLVQAEHDTETLVDVLPPLGNRSAV